MLTFSNRNEIKNHDFLIFELLIIELCNLKCSYCYMRNESPSWERYYNYETIIKIIDKLTEIDKPISICLSGGESSLHPKFLKIIEYIVSKLLNLHINTNFTLSLNKIKKIIELDKTVTFHISYHYDKNINNEEFLTKLLFLKENNINYELNIMLHPKKEFLIKIEEFINHIIKEELKFYLKPIYINSKYKPVKNVLEIMKKYNNYVYKEYEKIENKEVTYYSDFDLYEKNLIPLQTYKSKCYYIFFTIAGDGKIKEMCKLFNLKNIFKDIDFFKQYDITKPIICPFQNQCLWASSLDHLKEME